MKKLLVLALTLILSITIILSVAAPALACEPPPPEYDYSHGYWKNHIDAWPIPTDTPYDGPGDFVGTYLEALSAKGKGSDIIRDYVADQLNAALSS